MSEKDVCTTDASHNEKINEVVDVKKDKNEKSSVNVDNAIKTTTSVKSTTEPRKDRRIPDWLPEKDNVEVVEPLNKPPHLRSNVSLR